MGKKKRPTYTSEFKGEAVKLALNSENSVGETAGLRHFGDSDKTQLIYCRLWPTISEARMIVTEYIEVC